MDMKVVADRHCMCVGVDWELMGLRHLYQELSVKDIHQSTGEKKACQIMIICFHGPRGRFNLAIKFNEQLFFYGFGVQRRATFLKKEW